MGAMVSEAQRDRAAGMVAEAESQGARVMTGGRKMNIPGAFLEPTVMAGVTPDMVIAQEEVFGPVLSVIPFKDEAQAIEIANGTQYGIVGGVFTRDLDPLCVEAHDEDRPVHNIRDLAGGEILGRGAPLDEHTAFTRIQRPDDDLGMLIGTFPRRVHHVAAVRQELRPMRALGGVLIQ